MAPRRLLSLLLFALAASLAAAQPSQQGQLEVARLFGNIHEYAYYFVDILVGTPVPQRQSVILDTGSTVLAFPCTNCRQCGNHIDAPFDFSASQSAVWQECDSSCSSCRSGKCSYYQGYTEGSHIAGFWFTDYVRLGDADPLNPAVKAYMGCHDEENKLFTTQKAAGIMGVAFRRSRDHPTIIDALFGDKNIKSKTFAICLADHGGLLTVGGYNATQHRTDRGPIQWTPLIDHTYYTVGLQTLKLGSDLLGGATSWGNTIIDSGTTYTYLPPDIWRAFKGALTSKCGRTTAPPAGGTANAPGCRARLVKDSGDICWRLDNGPEDLDTFPVFDLTFGGDAKFKWRASSYLYSKGSPLYWCLAVDDNFHKETVLGMSFMIGHDVIFDRDQDKVGLVEANCPQFVTRPDAPDSSRPLPLPAELLPNTPAPIVKEFTTLPPSAPPRKPTTRPYRSPSTRPTPKPSPDRAYVNATLDAPNKGKDMAGASVIGAPERPQAPGAVDKGGRPASWGMWTAAALGVGAIVIAMVVIIFQTLKNKKQQPYSAMPTHRGSFDASEMDDETGREADRRPLGVPNADRGSARDVEFGGVEMARNRAEARGDSPPRAVTVQQPRDVSPPKQVASISPVRTLAPLAPVNNPNAGGSPAPLAPPTFSTLPVISVSSKPVQPVQQQAAQAPSLLEGPPSAPVVSMPQQQAGGVGGGAGGGMHGNLLMDDDMHDMLPVVGGGQTQTHTHTHEDQHDSLL